MLRFVIDRMPFAMGRPSVGFSLAGYALIGLAGAMMLIQSLRPAGHPHSVHALTAGVGLLPCPLTISVLGFAWVQSTAPMVALVLLSLTAGIATTIGAVALLAVALMAALLHVLSGSFAEARFGAEKVCGKRRLAVSWCQGMQGSECERQCNGPEPTGSQLRRQTPDHFALQ